MTVTVNSYMHVHTIIILVSIVYYYICLAKLYMYNNMSMCKVDTCLLK